MIDKFASEFMLAELLAPPPPRGFLEAFDERLLRDAAWNRVVRYYDRLVVTAQRA